MDQFASSAIRRLQLYQMQEAELIKQAAKEAANKVVQQVERGNEQEQRKTATQRTRKAEKKISTVVEREKHPKIRFKRKPIYTNPTPLTPILPVWLSIVSYEISQWYANIFPLWEEHRKRIIFKRSAANDAEYRIRLLLLAA
jgi:Fe2+ transport system protein B